VTGLAPASLPGPTRLPSLRPALALLVPLVVLVVAAGRAPVGAGVAALVPLYGLGCLLAWRRPRAALGVGAAVMVLVPIYYGRYAVGTLAVTPVIAVCLVLLPVALTRSRRVLIGPLDVAVAAYVLVRALSLLVNYSTGVGALAGLLLGVALPYVVLRLLTAEADQGLLAWVVVLTGAVLSVVAMAERAGSGNPYFSLLPATYQPELAEQSMRLGTLRAEGSFGDPIAFGLFLALALVLGACLSLTAASLRSRLAALTASGLVLYGLTATQSRGALLVAVVGTSGWLVLTRRLDVRRLSVVVAAVAVVVVTTPVLGTVLALKDSSTGDTRESRSATYRLEILSVARDPESFSLLGQQTEDAGGITLSVSSRVGLKSLDSEFALVYFAGGLLGLLAFTAVAGLVLRVAARSGLRPLERAWALGVGASYLNLLTVALFTQEAGLLWGWTALTASVAQRVARDRTGSLAGSPKDRLTGWTQ
jgi:hypothetical protein